MSGLLRSLTPRVAGLQSPRHTLPTGCVSGEVPPGSSYGTIALYDLSPSAGARRYPGWTGPSADGSVYRLAHPPFRKNVRRSLPGQHSVPGSVAPATLSTAYLARLPTREVSAFKTRATHAVAPERPLITHSPVGGPSWAVAEPDRRELYASRLALGLQGWPDVAS